MSFQLILKGSLGDHVAYTGLPEALYKHGNIKIEVVSKFTELFKYNPFVQRVLSDIDRPTNSFHLQQFEEEWQDYLIYRPVRVYYQITGKIIDRNEVQPNLYIPRDMKHKYIVMADQTGWPSRRGYKYFDELAIRLLDLGYHIIVIHNPEYKNCFGNLVPREIQHYNISTRVEYSILINIINKAQYFIGYDSGIANLAGALKIPSIIFAGSVPPIVFRHNSCIKIYDTCEKHCHSERCNIGCLSTFLNVNTEIIKIIEKGEENGYRGN